MKCLNAYPTNDLKCKTPGIKTKGCFLSAFVKNYEGGNYAWNPTAACQKQDNQQRSATLIQNGKGRKDYAKQNSQ